MIYRILNDKVNLNPNLNSNPKIKRLQKVLTYSSSIDNDNILQKSIKLISNGKKTQVDTYTRNNDDIRKKTIQFDNNKTNLAKLLKVEPVFEDLDIRLYNDFLVNTQTKSKSKSKIFARAKNTKKLKIKSKKQKTRKNKKIKK